jgi:hypothetical protein
MKLVLLPQPKELTLARGTFALPAKPSIGLADSALYPVARDAAAMLGGATINATIPGVADTLTLALDAALPAEGYTLAITPAGIRLVAATPAGAFYGLQTLIQIHRQSAAGRLPCLAIRDWPDFQDRGVYYDVCRGRVPTLRQLLALARALAHYKINHLQLYVEHTFVFRGHPDIGKDASPLSAEDILALDACCRDLHIELVPSLASFGHLATVLNHPQYRHLAEDWGEGRLLNPEAQDIPSWARPRGWTLSPANPDIYPFLDSLFAEFLPLFSSKRFNVCCDETWDLGMGQSYELCRARGKGVVYLDHIRKLNELSAQYGKRIMFWGDIIRHYPALIPQIPKDVTVLDWGYAWNHPFERIEDFKRAGLEFIACPGTSGWVSLFPRLPEAEANIAGFAAAGHRHGARGVLNTDWGDGGHYNFMELSFHGYLFGAEQSWNTAADRTSFTPRFARLFLGSDDPALVKAIRELGEITHLNVQGYYQSVWQTALFAHATAPVFTSPQPVNATFIRNGRITTGSFRFTAAYGAAVRKRLAAVRATLAKHAGRKGEDPFGVLPYWLFAVDTIDAAARKLAAFGQGGQGTPAERAAIRKRLTELRARFRKLWLARNRPSEIRVTLARYDLAIRGDQVQVALARGDAPGRVKLAVRNVGEHAVTGAVRLQLTPAGRGEIRGAAELTFEELAPGAEQAAEAEVVLTGAARRVLLEAVPTVPFANNASLVITRDTAWTIPTVPPQPAAALLDALAAPARAVLAADDTRVAEIAAARMGDDRLAVRAVVRDAAVRLAEVPWQGSCLELFACAEGGNSSVAQVFLCPPAGDQPARAHKLAASIVPAPELEIAGRATADGYVVAAVIPLALLALPTGASRFKLEAIVTAALRPEEEHRRQSLFHSGASAWGDTNGYGTITVAG